MYSFRTQSGRPIYAFGAPITPRPCDDLLEALRAADALSHLIGADDYVVVYRRDVRVYEARGKASEAK